MSGEKTVPVQERLERLHGLVGRLSVRLDRLEGLVRANDDLKSEAVHLATEFRGSPRPADPRAGLGAAESLVWLGEAKRILGEVLLDLSELSGRPP